jgi:hypothetical protein
VPTPVLEPAEYLLMLAGLAGITLRLRAARRGK